MFIFMCTLSINIWERVENALNEMQWEVAHQLIIKGLLKLGQRILFY